ncbi:MAG: hypothetical protein AMS17_04430 [Spirochaetes bacterium DG_61]|nr:MAG: hypothetical protein AMS17_04430 [Spirochaetes bacterium DG_61]
MKQISLLIVVKEREPGILSIADGREKSLVPILDGRKIIDFYLSNLYFEAFQRVTVLTDREHTGIKDYLVFAYSSHRVKVISEPDILRAAMNILRIRKNECILLLRADHLFLPDWPSLKSELLSLPPDNFEIEGPQHQSIGFLLHNTKPFQAVKNRPLQREQKRPRIDVVWEYIANTLRPSVKKLMLQSHCMLIHTVNDYYTVHFSLLKRIEELIHLLPPRTVLNDEEPARVMGTGHVRNSYVSTSSIVEGFVEHSILFSHVRVGKNAKIINSIVMENNYIGNSALLLNSILCDGGELFSRMTPNIGEDAKIGEDDSRGSNHLYPEYLSGGITLIGQNVEIPKGFRISRNCYIGSKVGKSELKGLERVKAGDTVLQS